MKIRSFVAVSACDEVKATIQDFIKEVERPGIKFVDPENLHITLLFLGELSFDEVEEAKQKLGFLESFSKFTVKFKGTTFFGSPPRVIYASPISRDLKEQLFQPSLHYN